MDPEKLEQLAQVASWYYEENVSLNGIAKRLKRSVSMVSRMLQEARDQNLVEIKIRYPVRTDSLLEQKLCETFGLQTAQVYLNREFEDSTVLQKCLAQLGARYLQQQLKEDSKIGIGWGSSVYNIVAAMPYLSLPKTQVIQVSGAVGGTDPTVDGAQMARWLAQKLDASSRFLHTPLIVQSEVIAQALREDPTLIMSLKLAKQVDLALIGVGTPYIADAGLRRAGYLSDKEVAQLKEQHAAGDIIGFHFNQAGKVLDTPLNRRIVGLTPEDLLMLPQVIVAAHGSEKVPAILASLKGRFISSLITDAITANLVLEHNSKI